MADQADMAPWKQTMDAAYADKAPEVAWEELEPREKLVRCLSAEIKAQAQLAAAEQAAAADAVAAAAQTEEEAAQAAEVRALRLATAEALVQQRAAELEAVEARVATFKDWGGNDPLSKVQVARHHVSVANARENLAEAKLKAMQCKHAM
jgi:hypothetical protein